MKTISNLFWVMVVIAFVVTYYNWVTSYNEGLATWQPIVEQCSANGGFMNAKGVCDYNQ